MKAVGLDEEPCALKYINSCIRNYYEDVKEEWIGRKQELEKMIDGEKEPYSDGIGFEILLNQASILCIRFFLIPVYRRWSWTSNMEYYDI